MRVSEIRNKRIRVNQGLGVLYIGKQKNLLDNVPIQSYDCTLIFSF